MKLEFSSVANAGELKSERIVLRASADADVGLYVVFRGINKNGTSVAGGSQEQTYWFPDQKVKAGDYVVLYTRDGETSIKDRDDGKKTYFFYWGLNDTLWVKGHTPVLIEINTWKLGTRFE
jgi:hypothetical protein